MCTRSQDGRFGRSIRVLIGASAPIVEAMERRALLSATLGADGTLVVTGTNQADTITVIVSVIVDSGGAGPVTVKINGVTQNFGAPAVKRIRVDAGGGDDNASVGGQDQVSENSGTTYINSVIDGGDGNDTLSAGLTDGPFVGPDDELDGGAGNDSLAVYHDGSGLMNGGDGNDTFYGNADFTLSLTIFGGNGDDSASKNLDASIQFYDGGAGFNTYNARVNGSPFPTVDLNDGTLVNVHHVIANGGTVLGSDQADLIEVSGESVTVDGRGGNDTVTGSLFEGSISGGDGNDSLSITGDNNTLTGGAENDRLVEDSGFTSNGGTASLLGGDGNDSLIGGHEADRFSGGNGVDTVDYSARTARVTVGIGTFADDGEAGEGDNVLSDNEIVLGGSGGDCLKGNTGNDQLFGNDGNDTLLGQGGNDSLYGGDGNDLLDGGTGADLMRGGAGTGDTVDYSSRTKGVTVGIGTVADDGELNEHDNVFQDVERVFGGSGNDSLKGNAGANALFGNGGNDSLEGGGGVDALFGGAGNDTLRAKDGLKDFIDGGAGIDNANTDLIDTVQNVETVTH